MHTENLLRELAYMRKETEVPQQSIWISGVCTSEMSLVSLSSSQQVS